MDLGLLDVIREYSFYPRTWVLPGELSDFRAQFDEKGNSIGNKIYIIKPDTGCQGRGIFLTRTFDQVPQHENVVAQLYIKKPLLLDGYKFDLRIYVMVFPPSPLDLLIPHPFGLSHNTASMLYLHTINGWARWGDTKALCEYTLAHPLYYTLYYRPPHTLITAPLT